MDNEKLEKATRHAAAELASCGMAGAAPLAAVLAIQQNLIDQQFSPSAVHFADHPTLARISRSFEDIEASLRDNPNEDKLSFSAAEMRMVLAAGMRSAPTLPVGIKKWSAIITSENMGMLAEFGHVWRGAPEHYPRVTVYTSLDEAVAAGKEQQA